MFLARGSYSIYLGASTSLYGYARGPFCFLYAISSQGMNGGVSSVSGFGLGIMFIARGVVGFGSYRSSVWHVCAWFYGVGVGGEVSVCRFFSGYVVAAGYVSFFSNVFYRVYCLVRGLAAALYGVPS